MFFRQMLESMELDDYRAVVCWKKSFEISVKNSSEIFLKVSVSGDGLLHELLNGLASREDWDTVLSWFLIDFFAQ